MLFGGGWPYLTRGRGTLLLVALIVLAALLVQTRPANQALISRWQSQGPASLDAAQAGLADQANPLVARTQLRSPGAAGALRPSGNPLGDPQTVMTQGYGVGTHAPAAVWGAVDLAISGAGNGVADPESTLGKPIYATHSGVVKVTPNSHPAGNHVWVTNDEYRTGYAHLLDFAVSDGQQVQRGDLLGYIGSTGMSSGPHLDYQVWQKENGVWVNLNPLEFEVFE